jgi:zinc protease
MTVVPDLVPPSPLRLSEHTVNPLPNGLTVVSVRHATVPVVQVRLRVPVAGGPAENAVLAELLVDRLDGRRGAEFSARATPDHLAIDGQVYSPELSATLGELARALQEPWYDEAQMAAARHAVTQRVNATSRSPGSLVRSILAARLYGSHPYAFDNPRAADVARVRKLPLPGPRGATLALVGDLDLDPGLTTALGAWSGDEPAVIPAVLHPSGSSVTLLHDPRVRQAIIRIALPAVPRRHPDSAALQVANHILGDPASGRLQRSLRDEMGLAYGARSDIVHRPAGSVTTIGATVAAAGTAVAYNKITELVAGAAEPLPRAHWERNRRSATGGFLLTFGSQAQIADMAVELVHEGRSLDHLTDNVDRLSALTGEDVQRAAHLHLNQSRAVTVVLGDADALEPHLAGAAVTRL